MVVEEVNRKPWIEHWERVVYNYKLEVSMGDREPEEYFEDWIRQVKEYLDVENNP